MNDYNTIRPHSSLNYLTPEEFESAIMNEDFRKEWIEKQMNVKNLLNSLNDFKKLSEESGSTSNFFT